MHGNHNPHNARAGALLIHRPAWVDQHTGGSRLTPTVHLCPKGMAVCGLSPQQQHNTLCLHTVQKHPKHLFFFFFLFFPCFFLYFFFCFSMNSTIIHRFHDHPLPLVPIISHCHQRHPHTSISYSSSLVAELCWLLLTVLGASMSCLVLFV